MEINDYAIKEVIFIMLLDIVSVSMLHLYLLHTYVVFIVVPFEK